MLEVVGYDTGDTEVCVQEVRGNVRTTHDVGFTACDLNVRTAP